MPMKWSGEKTDRSFNEYSFELSNWANVVDRTGAGFNLLKQAANETSDIDDAWVVDQGLTYSVAEELSRVLSTILVSSTSGGAATTVRMALQVNFGNGFRAWQQLCKWYRPNNTMEASTALAKILSPERQSTVHSLHKAVSEWELRVAEYESRFNRTVDEATKLSAMKRMMPFSILDRYMDTVTTYMDLRSRLANYMSEYISNGVGGKSGPTPMDIGSLDKGEEQKEDNEDPITKLAKKVDELCALDRKGKGKGRTTCRAGRPTSHTPQRRSRRVLAKEPGREKEREKTAREARASVTDQRWFAIIAGALGIQRDSAHRR